MDEARMTPQEQQLISQLFDRLKSAPRQAKDPEADALIRRGVAEIGRAHV